MSGDSAMRAEARAETTVAAVEAAPPPVTIVVPAYNEEGAIAEVARGLAARFPEWEVLVVDDGSSDGTAAALAAIPEVRTIRHTVNRGYGASWRTGIANARGAHVAFFDGDGQFDTEDLARLHAKALAENLDMVSGWRQTMQGVPLKRKPGKWVLGRLADFLVQRKVPDLNCGLRIMRRDVIRRYAHLLPLGFSASTTSMLVLMKRGYAVDFVPIRIRERVGKSTVRIFRDGFGTILLMIRLTTLLDPLRVFLPVAAVLTGFAVVYSLAMALAVGEGVPVLGGVAALGGLLVFLMGIIADQISALRLERFEAPPG
ncbi:glycosyltransferase family 2 protein [Salinarimonas sp. NSM]|uniref:glycosyltransferase family 2 protein n=1 Tax=Salinarimonas sp. NSM TaxID=3458003 RepID=UPI004036866C